MKKLLLTLIAVFTASVSFAQTELLTNGSFEEWTDGVPTGWLIAKSGENTAGSNVNVAQSTGAKEGTYAVAMTNKTASYSKPQNGRIASEPLKLKAGTYTYTVYLRAGDEAGAASRIGYVPLDATGKPGTYEYSKNENGFSLPDTLTTEWFKKTQEFTLSATTSVCLVVMHSKNYADKTVLVDAASLTTTDGGIDESGDDIPDTPEDASTIAEILAMTSGTASIGATVYAVSKNGFVIGDGTGFMYVYKYDSGISVGDVISITDGPLSVYGGFTQFNNPDVEVTGSATPTYPAIVEMDGAALDAWYTTPVIQYAKVVGTLTISGNYYNLAVEGASSAVASLVGPTADVLAEGVTNNSKVTVEGFAMYTSGSKYVNFICTKVTIDEAGETKDITNTPETAYTTTEAKEIIDGGLGLEQRVYVKGTVSQIGVEKDGEMTDLPGNEYKNATYFITDGTTEIEVYHGRYIENTDFTSADQLAVGDEVIVYGMLQKYKETYEILQDNYIYSLNGETNGISSVKSAQQDGAIYDLSGRRVAKAVKGIYIMNGKKFVK